MKNFKKSETNFNVKENEVTASCTKNSNNETNINSHNTTTNIRNFIFNGKTSLSSTPNLKITKLDIIYIVLCMIGLVPAIVLEILKVKPYDREIYNTALSFVSFLFPIIFISFALFEGSRKKIYSFKKAFYLFTLIIILFILCIRTVNVTLLVDVINNWLKEKIL